MSSDMDDLMDTVHDPLALPISAEEAELLLASTNDDWLNTSPSQQFKQTLETINGSDINHVAQPEIVKIKAAYSVRNVALLGEHDANQVMTQSSVARGAFYRDQNWWWQQINTAQRSLAQQIPYLWAKNANVLEFTMPHAYYYFMGQHQAQTLQMVRLPLDEEKCKLLPIPAKGSDGIYRIRISFAAVFGPTEAKSTEEEDLRIFQQHLQIIIPAARLLAETFWKLPHLNMGEQAIRGFANQAYANFRSNCLQLPTILQIRNDNVA